MILEQESAPIFFHSGLSVEVDVLTSFNGGIFSIIIDGFNTTSTIDTYAGNPTDNATTFPLCYPNRFPPMGLIPQQYFSKGSHTISLVFIGPSPNAQSPNSSQVMGQFVGFSIPDLSAPLTNSGRSLPVSQMLFVLINTVFIWTFVI